MPLANRGAGDSLGMHAPRCSRAAQPLTQVRAGMLPGEARMRVVFALIDSLNREALEPYGGTAIPTPSFKRLAERAITFDRH